MLFNCGVGKDSWESLGLQRDPTSQLNWNQSWIVIGRTDVEAEIPILWSTEVRNWLIGKDPDVGKIEGGRRRRWQRMKWLSGITAAMGMSSFGSWWWTGKPGVLQSMGCKESDMTEWLNWAECAYKCLIQRIIRDYYKQLYASKMENLKKWTDS